MSARVSTRIVGSPPARRVSSSLSCWSAAGRRPGRAARWMVLHAGSSALMRLSTASWNFSVRSSTAASAKMLARFCADSGARPLGGDDDEVALGDRVRDHVLQQRAGAAVGLEVLLRAPRHVDRGHEAGGRRDVARRVAGLGDQPEPGERRVVRGTGVTQVRLGLVGLLGGAHVEHGGQRRDEHRQDDQLEPLPDGLDVAAQSLLLARRDQPVGLCLDGVDQFRSEVPRGPAKDSPQRRGARRFEGGSCSAEGRLHAPSIGNHLS